MKKNVKLITLFTLLAVITFFGAGCKKNPVQESFYETNKTGQTSPSARSGKLNLPSTSSLRQEISTTFDQSQTIQITIWADYVDGSHPHAEVTVDPDYVLIGGGAQITNFSNNSSGVNALLTGAYPKDDGTFSTFVADSKDHLAAYNHRLWVYAIGMKLYPFGSPSHPPIPRVDITSNMNLTKVTSASSGHPLAISTIPSGYKMLSGGAKVNWLTPGNLLTGSSYNLYGNGSTEWRAVSKDHIQASNATIESYVLSISPNIFNFWGSLQTTGYTSVTRTYGGEPGITQISTTNISTNIPGGDEPWLIAGTGGISTYNGVGRMLTAFFPNSTSIATIRDKDHLQVDGGYLYGQITAIRKGY